MRNRRKKNKDCPIYKGYFKNRTDTLMLIEYYDNAYYCIEISKIYSVVKPIIIRKAISLLINLITYHRKMVNEWSGKNLSNVWR